MDTFLIILGFILIFFGLIGCFAPIIPGPPLSFIALILLQITDKKPFSTDLLLILGIVTFVVTILDYLIPIWGTKKFGGSKQGVWGSTIGLILGLFFFPPLGIIIGPFIGAFVGELLVGKKSNIALKSALGSFIGFLLGTLAKFVTSGVMTWYFLKAFF